MEVSVRELKDHLSEYLRRAAAGEEIVVTSHARPIARLSGFVGEALSEEEQALARLRAQPWVSPAQIDGGLHLPRPRLKLEPGEKTVAERVVEDRG